MKDIKIGQEDKENPCGINHEIVRYYPIDFTDEKFPARKRNRTEWKDMSNDELLAAREEILKEIFKRFGS